MAINTIKSGKLEYQAAEGICVPHCFTTRFGGVSTGVFDSLLFCLSPGERPLLKKYCIQCVILKHATPMKMS